MSKVSLSEFADKINEILPQIIREFIRRQTNELSKGRLTLPQFLILSFLNERKESKMTDLARFMRVSTAAMTGIVNRLVEAGYAVRIFDPHDRRIIKINLTAKGEVLVRNIGKERRRMIMNVFSKVSENDRTDYLRIITRIKEILNEAGSLKK
jgi:DNA-binding MarR family transcriptional regulator